MQIESISLHLQYDGHLIRPCGAPSPQGEGFRGVEGAAPYNRFGNCKSSKLVSTISICWFHNVISTESPSWSCTSISFHFGCVNLYFLIAQNRIYNSLADMLMFSLFNALARRMADNPLSTRLLGRRSFMFFPPDSFTMIRIGYSTKIRTISPSEDSTSTRFPTTP